MRAQGVPWDSELEDHPLHLELNTKGKNKGIASELYKPIAEASYKHLPLNRLWKSDIDASSELNRQSIWSNINISSRNPNHQMIHYKFVHRSYFTAQRLHQTRLKNNPSCDFCPGDTVGTFFHLVWHCPEVNRLWKNISSILSDVTERAVHY